MSNFEVVVNLLPFWEPLLQSLISSAEMTLALHSHNSIFPTRLNKPQSCQCVDLHVTRDSQTRSLKLLTRIYYTMNVDFVYIYEMRVQNLDILCIFHVICDNPNGRRFQSLRSLLTGIGCPSRCALTCLALTPRLSGLYRTQFWVKDDQKQKICGLLSGDPKTQVVPHHLRDDPNRCSHF